MNQDLEIIGLKKRVRNLRILVVTVIAISASFIVVDFYASLSMKEERDKAVEYAKEYDDLKVTFNNVLEALHMQNDRVLELEDANEQLIAHCRPCDVNKAIKATPLPELKKDR